VLAETRFEAKYIMKMELLLLTTLEWRVAAPTPVAFLEHFLRSLAVRHAGRRRGLRAHARELVRRTLNGALRARLCAPQNHERCTRVTAGGAQLGTAPRAAHARRTHPAPPPAPLQTPPSWRTRPPRSPQPRWLPRWRSSGRCGATPRPFA
jgi:hypothetical protein